MSRLNLVIADHNTRYMNNLATFILSNYRHRFNVQTFSDRDSLYSTFPELQEKTDVLLLSGDWYADWSNKPDGVLTITFDSEPRSGHSYGTITIDRFCGADSLIGNILKIYAEQDGSQYSIESVRGTSDNKVIIVYAPCGGVGRTSISIGLSAIHTKKRHQTLYLNLDGQSVDEFAFGASESSGLSEIIFSLKTRPEKLGLKLEALKRVHPHGQFYYYTSPQYPLDLDEIKTAELETLINRLRTLGIFDRILIDVPCGLTVKNKMLLELADSILVVSECSQIGIQKLLAEKKKMDKVFLDQAQYIYKRSTILLNKADELNQSLVKIILKQAEEVFRSKAFVLPYCEFVSGNYSVEDIVCLKHKFGRALAELVNI